MNLCILNYFTTFNRYGHFCILPFQRLTFNSLYSSILHILFPLCKYFYFKKYNFGNEVYLLYIIFYKIKVSLPTFLDECRLPNCKQNDKCDGNDQHQCKQQHQGHLQPRKAPLSHLINTQRHKDCVNIIHLMYLTYTVNVLA